MHLLPQLFAPEQLRGGVAVVIDVLRASTTIVHALAAGAKAVIPCEEVDEARRLAVGPGGGNCLLGGERHGVRIEGFDLDNSPLAYTATVVAGKTVLFTTTNGTRALARCRLAGQILIGAFVNRQAILDTLADETRSAHLVCAGTDGAVSAEDVLLAGTLADELLARGARPGNDETRIAAAFYRSHAASGDTLFEALCDSAGGRNLLAAGFEQDIRLAAEVSRFDIVPKYHSQSNAITQTIF